jgi:lysophospholipase L1-like esterase
MTTAALCTGGAQAGQAAGWVTGWEAPPVDANGSGFSAQTLRLIVTPHASGTRARVVLSNLFGSGPVTITAATIARRASGAALVPGTVAQLTFGGRPAITIPAGQQATSDPATITVSPFQDLAVSLAFGPPTGPPTNHFNGLQTSYVSAVGSGDQTGSVDGSPFAATTTGRFFLTAVQVLAPAPAKTLVAVGDSIADGGLSEPDTLDKNARWPDYLERRLLGTGSALSIANAAITGNSVTLDGPANQAVGGPSLEHRFDRDVLAQPGLGGIIVSEGINDIGLATDNLPAQLGLGASPAGALIAGLQSIAERAHAAGVPVMIGTLTPIQGSFYDNQLAESARNTVNAWIRNQHVFDGVIDFAAAVQDPSDPGRLLPAYDSGDHLHPNAAGFAAMAQAIDLDGLRRLVGDQGVSTTPATAKISWRRAGGCKSPRLILAVRVGGPARLRWVAVRIDGDRRHEHRLDRSSVLIAINAVPRRPFDATAIVATSAGISHRKSRFGHC